MPPIKVKMLETEGGKGGAKAPSSKRPRAQTRIQREKQEVILEAALDVFSREGFRGAPSTRSPRRRG